VERSPRQRELQLVPLTDVAHVRDAPDGEIAVGHRATHHVGRGCRAAVEQLVHDVGVES
jgi:hypothetical protein